MIEEVEIRNYKSITELTLPLGRINVLIGANGSGKSNILEALAFGSAAANDKLDNEFLASRGIRVSDDPRFMRAAFDKEAVANDVELTFRYDSDTQYTYTLQKDNKRPYSPWKLKNRIVDKKLRELVESIGEDAVSEIIRLQLRQETSDTQKSPLLDNAGLDVNQNKWVAGRALNLAFGILADLQSFLVYSPENSALRTFEQEGQIQPLGIRGEGLFKLLRVMSAQDESGLEELRKRLLCID